MKFQFCLAKPEEGGVALDDSSTKHSGRYLQILYNNYKVFSSNFEYYENLLPKAIASVRRPKMKRRWSEMLSFYY